MRRTRMTCLLLAVLLSACSVSGPDDGTSSLDASHSLTLFLKYPWLADLTDEILSQPVANPPLWIGMYRNEGHVYFYLPPQCCDIMSILFDEGGSPICAPDGGFSGGGSGDCPPLPGFWERMEIVWTDSRGPTAR